MKPKRTGPKVTVRVFDCICCLGLSCAEMRYDKYGRPYIRCVQCGTRVFISSAAGLRGWQYLAGMVGPLAAQLALENHGQVPVPNEILESAPFERTR